MLPLNDMLPELILEIFARAKTNLPNLALVNHRWCAIANSKVLREKIFPESAIRAIDYTLLWPHLNPAKELPLPHCVYRDFQEGDLLTFIPEHFEITSEKESITKKYFSLQMISKLVETAKSDHKMIFSHGFLPMPNIEGDISEFGFSTQESRWVLIKSQPIGMGEPLNAQKALAKGKGNGAHLSEFEDLCLPLITNYFKTGDWRFSNLLLRLNDPVLNYPVDGILYCLGLVCRCLPDIELGPHLIFNTVPANLIQNHIGGAVARRYLSSQSH